MTRKKLNKKEEGYLSNKEMLAEVLECQKNDVISDKLGKMFMILATRYSTKPNFSGYSYRDEMVSNGIVSCCAALHKFDPTKSLTPNPFAYYTSIIHNCFIQILNKEKRQQEIRDQILVNNDMNPSHTYLEKHRNQPDDSSMLAEDITEEVEESSEV